jgi:hypothetical protein
VVEPPGHGAALVEQVEEGADRGPRVDLLRGDWRCGGGAGGQSRLQQGVRVATSGELMPPDGGEASSQDSPED